MLAQVSLSFKRRVLHNVVTVSEKQLLYPVLTLGQERKSSWLSPALRWPWSPALTEHSGRHCAWAALPSRDLTLPWSDAPTVTLERSQARLQSRCSARTWRGRGKAHVGEGDQAAQPPRGSCREPGRSGSGSPP